MSKTIKKITKLSGKEAVIEHFKRIGFKVIDKDKSKKSIVIVEEYGEDQVAITYGEKKFFMYEWDLNWYLSMLTEHANSDVVISWLTERS